MTDPSRSAPLLDAPEPSLFVAVSTPLDGSAWTPSVRADAADGGWFLGARARQIAAWGSAAVLPLAGGLDDVRSVRAAAAWLAAVPRAPQETGPALPPLALASLCFERDAPGALVVPATAMVRAEDGRVWRTEVVRRDQRRETRCAAPSLTVAARHPAGARPPHRSVQHPGGAGPAPSLRQVPAPGVYAAAVARAIEDIAAGALRKVVLSRCVELTLPHPAVASGLLEALWQDDAAFSPYSVPTTWGRLVGASPELVVSRLGRSVTSHAFAGTAALPDPAGPAARDAGEHGDAVAARLFASTKDRAEHALVVEQVADALAAHGLPVSVPDVPSVVSLRSDARLGTLLRASIGDLADPSPPGQTSTALELLALLHPTPAVGGVPRPDALARIAALETGARGPWAGVVGWVDAAGDGEWVLAIRNALLDGCTARVRAGAGVVAASEPLGELRETTVKLAPVLDALAPGSSRML